MEKIFAPCSVKNFETKYWTLIKIWIPVEKMIKFLNEHEYNWFVNVSLKTAKDGKKYIELDTYKNDEIDF